MDIMEKNYLVLRSLILLSVFWTVNSSNRSIINNSLLVLPTTEYHLLCKAIWFRNSIKHAFNSHFRCVAKIIFFYIAKSTYFQRMLFNWHSRCLKKHIFGHIRLVNVLLGPFLWRFRYLNYMYMVYILFCLCDFLGATFFLWFSNTTIPITLCTFWHHV